MIDERKRSSPWNMDRKKLTDYRARIAQAKPDVNRKESYILRQLWITDALLIAESTCTRLSDAPVLILAP